MSTDESFSKTGYEPKDYFLKGVDYDDATIGEMLFNAHREQVYHSQREGLSVGQSSSSVSDRSGQPVVEKKWQKVRIHRDKSLLKEVKN